MMTYKVVRQDGRAIPGLVFRKEANAKACAIRLTYLYHKGLFRVVGRRKHA
jgi:hypothetical protein